MAEKFCIVCHRPHSAQSHSVCSMCRITKRTEQLRAECPDGITCDCGRTITFASAVRRQSKCYTCRPRRKDRPKVRDRGLPPSMRVIPAGKCQVCGGNSVSFQAPDGSNVPCCRGCYDDCLTLMKVAQC